MTIWTKEEDNEIHIYYPTKGTNFHHPNKTIKQIQSRARYLNINTEKRLNTWTNSEIKKLIENYPNYGSDYKHPNKTNKDVIRKAHLLGLKKDIKNIIIKKSYRCNNCPNSDIKFKGILVWDEHRQRFKVENISKHIYCLSCRKYSIPVIQYR